MKSVPRPDHASRPLEMSCEYTVNASTSKVYNAWTRRFDTWFAQAGTLSMVPEVGRPFFFYTPDEWGRHPHYGRFLELVEDQLVEMTWMTGDGTPEGTQGAETIIRVELEAKGADTLIRMTHSGFVSEKSRDGHAENWPLAFEGLNDSLSGD
jgi:uncharacterized protein YndB with AHSA1/START domain